MRNIKGKNVPIGMDKAHAPKGSGEIIQFYDVKSKGHIGIHSDKVTSKKLKNGKYQLSAQAPHPRNDGQRYNLHKISATPA